MRYEAYIQIPDQERELVSSSISLDSLLQALRTELDGTEKNETINLTIRRIK